MASQQPNGKQIFCLRCNEPLYYIGRKRFHEGTQWGGILGDLGEFLENRVHFDVYVCPYCGKTELFLEGVGEDLRPQ